MQPISFITVLAVAMTTGANPALRARNDGGGGSGSTGGSCSTNEQPVCCSGILGNLACAVSVLGGNCNGDSFCCNTDAPVGALINIETLDCFSV